MKNIVNVIIYLYFFIVESKADSEYPKFESLLNFLEKWNPLNTTIPILRTDSLALLNFSDPIERNKAFGYREQGLPFKVVGVPYLRIAKEKWSEYYVNREIIGKAYVVEHSNSPHYLYWEIIGRNVSKDYVPPTDVVQMSFSEWLSLAKLADNNPEFKTYRFEKTNVSGFFYLHINSLRTSGKQRHFISRDLPFFSTRRENLFISDISSNKGIECRFGMRGVIAEPHCDTSRNMVAMIRGRKRIILAPPSSCSYLRIISDISHPSFRQSSLDWSDLQQAKQNSFHRVQAIETVVEAGEVLYIPPLWFHYIISLEYTIQCNSFSLRAANVSTITSDQCIADLYNKPKKT